MFYGYGAWVGRVTNVTTCSWWPDDPNNLGWDRTKLIATDLNRNPRAHIVNRLPIAQIEVDDNPGDGGLTKLGPMFPNGSLIDGVWIDSGFYQRLAATGNQPAWPPAYMNCEAYELMTVVYWNLSGGSSRRFWGFHAQITSTQGASMALCTIWHAATSRTLVPAGTWWIDLAHAADPIAGGFTEVGVGPSDAKRGALFLDAATTRTLGLRGPKLPLGAGADLIP